jgi:hypothetical protein
MEHVQQESRPTHFRPIVWVGQVLGVVLAVAGVWALVGAVYLAWDLFRDPDGIGYFARYFAETTRLSSYLPGDITGPSHFLSWIAVILLLLVIGKLGFWAVDAGARLIHPRA